MDSQIEEIKNRLNVLDIVGNYVKLTKTGVNYRGICPFHSEKGPSFFVSPARQMWKCFGCGKGGDIFAFIKEIEGVEFGDALRILAAKAGVELKRENPQLRSERQRLYEICDLSCLFFEKQLGASDWGKKAKEYLLKRGISEISIKKWRLGYSPDTWQGLSDFLVGRGYKREEILKAGLAVKSDKGNDPYDRFRGRIIFPIFDLNSQPIGFGARIFKEPPARQNAAAFGGAKYINTPQTLLYDKSNVLYGINFAKVPARKQNHCVLTEGYTDAIMAHQAGFENTVAVSGTALTPRHLNLLKRYTDNLLLAFDMDLAGNTATKRGIDLAESAGFNIKVINAYSEKDPADIILENPENWKASLEKSRTIMDYYFDSALSSFDKNIPQGKKEIGRMILPAIKRMPNKIEQSHWVGKLAYVLNVKEEAILEELKGVKQEIAAGQAVVAEEKIMPLGRKRLLEEKIVSLVIKNPENLNLVEARHEAMFSGQGNRFFETVRQNNIQPGQDFIALFAGQPDMKDFLEQAVLRAEIEEEGPEGPEKELQLCLLQLKDIELRNSLNNMLGLIKSESDELKKQELIKEFDKKAKELHQRI